jgi:hypothetical protein
MADNSTGLSFTAIVKWLLVIASLPCLVKAWQGIIGRVTATGYGRSDASTTQLLTEGAAVRYGLLNLLYAALLLGAAWALWYFWQRYED